MFAIDEKLTGIQAKRDEVIALYQSLNSPSVVIPGKQAASAQAYVVGLRRGGGFGVLIYLYLTELSECAVYKSEKKSLSPEDYQEEESEAMAFVESMGFMMDNLNFRTLAADRQAELLRTLPVFRKEPKEAAPAGAAAGPQKPSVAHSLGRLFASF